MKRNRPWDPKHNTHDGRSISDHHCRSTQKVPFVEVQGTKFFSDRFYLNEYDEVASIDQCHCRTPPMFSRSALVASLKLKAVILATYNLEINALVGEFPSIFERGSIIPCIVLHGQQGLTKDSIEKKLASKDTDSLSCAGDIYDEDSVIGNTDDIGNSLDGSNDVRRLSDHVYFSEIKTTWLEHIPTSLSEVCCKNSGFLRNEIIKQRRLKRGVHHPKFMILLEETGSIVVVVSTLNLTQRKRSIDGSWLQRFPPLATNKRTHRVAEDSVGAELTRFLHYQTLATAPEQMTVYGFAKRYMGWASLFDLSTHYDYERACVHIVATVPGDYTCTSFGQQRIADLTRKLPFALVSDNDRLIIQPTSIGAEWKDGEVVDLVRSYLDLDSDSATYRDSLRRLDIVWPTAHFIRNAGHRRSSVDPTFAPKRNSSSIQNLKNNEGMNGFIFLSSTTFNRIDVDCLSRMIMYEPCETQQRITSPHFKSIVRLYEGSSYRIRKEYGFPRCKELFSWFLLTSACFSKGAQGKKEGDIVSYANFELGVLFSSRHGGDRCSNNRIYCLKPERCVCSSDGLAQAELVHLPVPYCFRAPTYVENCDDGPNFCETPFFHEITPETAACGNMQLTPYGKTLSLQTNKSLY